MPVKKRILTFIWLLILLSPSSSHTEENTQPSLELLEFLGDFTTKEGNWVDPVELNEMNLADLEDKADENTK